MAGSAWLWRTTLAVALPACLVAPTVEGEAEGFVDADDERGEGEASEDPSESESGPIESGSSTALGESDERDASEGSPNDLPEPPDEPTRFVEVAALAGIDHVQSAMATPGNCLVDTVNPAKQGWFCSIDWTSGGAAAADFDQDGWVDLYVTRPYEPDLLYRNQGDGTFVDVAASVGLGEQTHDIGAAWADVDNDGDLDLYVTTIGELAHKLFINHEGTFVDEAQARGADLDDGYPQTGTTPSFGDYDNDGWLDLYVGDWHTHVLGTQPSHARLLRNRGEGGPGEFDDVTLAAGVDVDGVYLGSNGGIDGTFVFSAGFSDLDGDGWLDLLLASDFGCTRLFWNQGEGSFLDTTLASGVGTDENGMGSTIGDYDGDGDLDWFVTSIIGPDNKTGNRLYAYAGDRHFVDATDAAGVREGGWAWGTAMFDHDNDGDLDLALTNGWSGTLYRDDAMVGWTNFGEGLMIDSSAALELGDTGQGRALLTFDYDRDGDLDMFVANNAGKPLLLRNEGGNDRRWLQVEVRGSASNRDGLGARVWVSAAGHTQMQEVGGPTHFLGHSERVLHFGLGLAGEVDQVRVVWPASGAEQILTSLAVDQRVTIVEP